MRSISRIYAFLTFIFLSVALAGTVANAQQTDSTQTQEAKPQRWLVETLDGSVFQGVYLGQSEAGIRLLTDTAGEITIPMQSVKVFRILDERNFRNGAFWFDNPNATRYLFSPSAYSLRKGEAYYQNTYLVLSSFNYGVTDRFTIGAGFELISTFSGEPIFFITPKYSFPINEKWSAGAGVLYANAPIEDFDGLGIGYGIVTYGNRDNNATLGVGFGYVDGEVSGRPLFTLSGMTRIGRKTALVTENWIVPTDTYYGVYSYGIRFMGEKITVDLAFLNSPDIARDVLSIGIPYVDFVVKFGK
ncbi:hypothetical protein MKJ04_10310 [Pontibacter sp. E15-1]|uniref:hypothetical protein n=1 Tax=Pontibacter sp. E15-1 TaxID=2919918 RepID=UPI001F4FDC19|nr:hypothetical protein [Pontibacter sp. E15-1]MCJ8165236.1 hypothetical protein [Pontibacter sp. E15-1]